MNTNSAIAMTANTPGMVWSKAVHALKHEIGDDAFGSWLAPASVIADPEGGLCLVTPTGIARDWIRRYAWRRIGELWAANDPEGRELCLKSRLEFEAAGGDSAPAGARPTVLEIEAVDPVSTDAPHPAAPGL